MENIDWEIRALKNNDLKVISNGNPLFIFQNNDPEKYNSTIVRAGGGGKLCVVILVKPILRLGYTV